MSELRRRDQAAPARREGGVPARPDGPTRMEWEEPVGRVGWELVPVQAGELLTAAGLCVGEPIAAWATAAGVRDRGPSGYTQDIEGWWVNATCLVSVQARRPVVREQPGSRRFRPVGGGWAVTALVRPVTGQPRTQRWSRPVTGSAGGGAGGAGGAGRYTSDAMDLLPSAVRQVLGQPTQWGAACYDSGAGLHEHVVGYRQGDDRIVVLAADRRAGSFPDPATALDRAPWITTLLEGTLHEPVTRELPSLR